MRHLSFVAGVLLAGAAAAQDYAPAPWQSYRDANPFTAASGLPFALPGVAADGWHFELTGAASNTELDVVSPHEVLVFDAEIHEERLAITRAIGEHWLVRATFGREQFGRGGLDNFIEHFHDTFGFPRGDRGRLDTDGHEISYGDALGEAFVFDRTLSATQPLLLDAAWRRRSGDVEWTYGATLKVPVSHASPLVDDRATALSAWIQEQTVDAATRWPWGWRAGVMTREDSDLLPRRARKHAVFADAVLGYRITPQWDVSVQSQWHSALYHSDLDLLSSAGTLLVSSGWTSPTGWTLRGGLVEDVPALHTQDVTLFLSFGWTAR